MRRAVLAVLLLTSLTGCNSREKVKNGGGNADRGKQLVTKYGCDTCHIIPGVKGAQGMVGPTLEHIASRQTIASRFPNSPQTMMRWIQNPQSFDPQTSMPNMNVTPADARDITAYLFTLK